MICGNGSLPWWLAQALAEYESESPPQATIEHENFSLVPNCNLIIGAKISALGESLSSFGPENIYTIMLSLVLMTPPN